MHLHIISRKEAKLSGLKTYFTNKPCKYGHICERYVASGVCKQCHLLHEKKYNVQDPNRLVRRRKSHYDKNCETIKERSRSHSRENRDVHKIIELRYRKRNSKVCAQRAATYRNNNRGKCNSLWAARRARKRKATPPWLTPTDKQQIEQFYQTAAYLTSLTGIQFHVDHIIPLRGKYVSGLHIPSNLQILPFYDNLTKSNNYEHDNV